MRVFWQKIGLQSIYCHIGYTTLLMSYFDIYNNHALFQIAWPDFLITWVFDSEAYTLRIHLVLYLHQQIYTLLYTPIQTSALVRKSESYIIWIWLLQATHAHRQTVAIIRYNSCFVDRYHAFLGYVGIKLCILGLRILWYRTVKRTMTCLAWQCKSWPEASLHSYGDTLR